MPYDQIVFIGYVLDTTPKENDDGTSTYLGITPAVDDIDARCQLLAAAMESARSTLPPPASPPVKTLYVFMIPEFFFRGADPGAYDMADVQYAIAALQNLAAPARWTDWVFAFGTIIGAMGARGSTAACANLQFRARAAGRHGGPGPQRGPRDHEGAQVGRRLHRRRRQPRRPSARRSRAYGRRDAGPRQRTAEGQL